ncbi:AraC family transcriptional regulator ligand-binding domain-containing protein [Rhodococcus erythropolis]
MKVQDAGTRAPQHEMRRGGGGQDRVRSTVHWDHPRGLAGIALLIRFAEQRGVRPEECLRGSGLSPTALADHSALIDSHQEIVVARNVFREFGELPGLGIEVGSLHHLSAYGPLGYALMSAETLGEMAEIAMEFIILTHCFSSITMTLNDSGSPLMAFEGNDVPEDIRRFLIERDMAATITMHRDMLGDPALSMLANVALAFPACESKSYDRHFQVDTMFDQNVSQLTFIRDESDFKLPQRNSYRVQEYLQSCIELRRIILERDSVSATLRARLTERGGFDEGLEAAARALFLSPRTLRRRLAEEGTSYRQIAEDVRRTIATDLLYKHRLSKAVVAERLGYRDASSLRRAARRWNNSTAT